MRADPTEKVMKVFKSALLAFKDYSIDALSRQMFNLHPPPSRILSRSRIDYLLHRQTADSMPASYVEYDSAFRLVFLVLRNHSDRSVSLSEMNSRNFYYLRNHYNRLDFLELLF